MRDIRLQKLTLRNFKGCREYTLTPDGKNLSVLGDNATGKTTLMDAFTWVLTGKDSLGQAEFEVKPIGNEGSSEVEVEALLLVDGNEMALGKILAEKWTKKRGSATPEFTGHETKYSVDGVPKQQKEYQSFIAELANADLFRLLTNTRYFSEGLSWQERRRLLLEVCGDITDADVIASDPALAELPRILGKHSLDDYCKIIKGRKAQVNDSLKQLPARIDEVNRSLPTEEIDHKSLRSQIGAIETQLKGRREALVRIQTGGEVAQKLKELAEIDAKIATLTGAMHAAQSDGDQARQREIDELERKLWHLNEERKGLVVRLDVITGKIERNTEQISSLRAKWSVINERKFDSNLLCPTCGQRIPEAEINESMAAFNQSKAERMKAISAQGKELSAESKTLDTEAEENKVRQVEIDGEFAAIKSQIQAIKDRPKSENESNPELLAAMSCKAAIEVRISDLRLGLRDSEAEVQAEIEAFERELSTRKQALAAADQAESARKRIQELNAEQKKLAAEFERLERELFLCEEFTRRKVSMLNSKINDRFSLCSFRLFEDQINGGLRECCELTVNGVPYSSLNTGGRINAGIEIADVLSEHYGVRLPMFLDNCESVTRPIESQSQQIRLIVSEAHKTLTVQE